ncbi:hypothetical protein ACROYT_G032330 [Oculina patagonica]
MGKECWPRLSRRSWGGVKHDRPKERLRERLTEKGTFFRLQNWMAFSKLHKPLFTEHGSVKFPNTNPPTDENNNAYCEFVPFTRSYNITPSVLVSANHSTTASGNLAPVHNGITTWIENMNASGFRACIKELYETRYDPVSVSYAVLTDICEPGWSYFNGFCYFTSETCTNWTNALSKCQQANSVLVDVNSNEENVYIQHRHNGEKSWLGLNDRSTEGDFTWADVGRANFTAWAKNQPNNNREEDCVYALGLKLNYKWNDVKCSDCHQYTCKKDLNECEGKTHSCDQLATCVNKRGSYSCKCSHGNAVDGFSCYYAGKGKKEKRARPSSSTGDECDQDGRHYEEILAHYKALEQKDAEKSVEIAKLKALLQEAKDDLKALNDKVDALKASVQFTQKEQDEVKDRLTTCEKDQIRQENELTRQSIYSRRWNLLFFKINESKDENCHLLVKDVLTNGLKFEEEYVNNIPLCGVHRLGKKRPDANQPRPIIVRFTCRADRDHVWRQRRHLEGSDVRMAEDLPFHVREIRKNILLPALKKAKTVPSVKASIIGDKLVVNGRRYTFNKIPMKWRNDLQPQDVPAEESQDLDDPTSPKFEPSQATPEIT